MNLDLDIADFTAGVTDFLSHLFKLHYSVSVVPLKSKWNVNFAQMFQTQTNTNQFKVSELFFVISSPSVAFKYQTAAQPQHVPHLP